MKTRIQIALALALLMLVSFTQSAPQRFDIAKKSNAYNFEINIITGSLSGNVYKGSFSYTVNKENKQGLDTVLVDRFDFNYKNHSFTKNNLDWVPKVILKDGKFQKILFVGGDQTMRFGLNIGFERYQFNSPGEEFIRNGDSYFGYLNSRTYVEGSGKFKCSKIR